MNINVSLYKNEDLLSLDKSNHLVDVTLGCLELSSDFSHDLDQMHELAQVCASKKINCFFQWDILMTENDFERAAIIFKKIKWQLFSAIRVKDPGALYYLREHFPQLKTHLIAEAGNHNEIGILSWIERFPNISRVVLSPELSFEIIKEQREKIPHDIELEVLAMGMVLLFYTPRSLLTPLKSNDSKFQWAKGTSEESPHSGFPLLENVHGTYMFNTKDIYIFDEKEKVNELAKSGLIFRVGLIDCSLRLVWEMIKCDDNGALKSLKETCIRPFIKGFFRTNKTDVLFKKLKNSRIQNRDESFLGEVVEVKKKTHVGLYVKEDRTISIGDELLFSTPEGNEKNFTVKRMSNGAGSNIDQANGGEVVFFPPVGGVSVRTLVHKKI